LAEESKKRVEIEAKRDIPTPPSLPPVWRLDKETIGVLEVVVQEERKRRALAEEVLSLLDLLVQKVQMTDAEEAAESVCAGS
jgi:hypothetical protein